MRFARRLLIGVLLCTAPAWAQEKVAAKLEVSEAAELAADLEAQASTVKIDAPSEAGETLHAYVDKMAAIATELETELRAGKEKGDTQELYRELRRIRLDVLELVRSGKVELPPGSAESFEKLLDQLGRYHGDTR